MILEVSSPPPGANPSWSLILATLGALVVALIAVRKFATGWGDGGQRLEGRPDWRAFLVSLGFALMPVTCSLALALGTLLTARLFYATDIDALGVLAVLLAVGIPVCFIWGLIEAKRPNRWRRIPRWLTHPDR